MPAYLIDDGSNYSGAVPARVGGLAEFTFDYRPAVSLRCMKHAKATKGVAPEVELAEHVKLIVEHVHGWNVVTRDGMPVPMDATTVTLVPWPALLGMVNHVQGFGGKVEAADQGN